MSARNRYSSNPVRPLRCSATIIAICLFFGCAVSTANAQIVSSLFTSSAEGWSIADWNIDMNTVVGTYSVTYNSSGGNPGGYISSTDPSGNWFFFSAPTAYLGNKSAAYGGSLTFSLKDSANDPGSFPVVILTGAGLRLYYNGTAPGTGWTNYTVGLGITGWKVSDPDTGANATVSQMQTVLANLNGLYIDGDWNTGNDNSGLDTVKMFAGAVPEPGPVAFGFASVVSVVVTMLKRKLTARR